MPNKAINLTIENAPTIIKEYVESQMQEVDTAATEADVAKAFFGATKSITGTDTTEYAYTAVYPATYNISSDAQEFTVRVWDGSMYGAENLSLTFTDTDITCTVSGDTATVTIPANYYKAIEFTYTYAPHNV